MYSKTNPSTRRKATTAAIIAAEGALCPLCRWRVGTELHEIIPRSRLAGNPAAMDIVFASPILCALVCHNCHPKGNDFTNHQLMAWKISRYGHKAMMVALARVNEHLTDKIKASEYGVET